MRLSANIIANFRKECRRDIMDLVVSYGGEPPLAQESMWSIVKPLPHAQVVGTLMWLRPGHHEMERETKLRNRKGCQSAGSTFLLGKRHGPLQGLW